MKQFWLLVLGILIAVPSLCFGDSGINWTASTMQVSFTRPAGITEPAFSCFGTTTENPPFSAQATLESLGYDNQANPRIENCFQQAGNYTVTIALIDNAGNLNSNQVFRFRIAPSDPSAENSSVGPANCTQIADGSQPCALHVTLRDEFLNPVTQINEAEIFSDTEDFADDANLETSFREGLWVDDVPLPNVGAPAEISDASLADGVVGFSLKAFAPSIAKVGYYLAKLVNRDLSLSARVPEIDDAGEVTGNPSITISSPVSVQFENPFSFRPGGTSFIWSSEEGAHGEISVSLSGANFPPTPRGTLFNQNPDFEYIDENIPENGMVFDFADGERTPRFETTVRPEGFEEGVVINDESALALSTEVEYSIDSIGGVVTVKYPAGGAGLENLNGAGGDPAEHQDVIGYGNEGLNFGIVGADIEGGIIGDARKMVVQALMGSDNTFQIGRSVEDFRKIILENTARLSRGAENVYNNRQSYNFSDDLTFDNEHNTAIVIFESGNPPGTVVISAPLTLPQGKNTLIIKNGNLIIEDSVKYDENQQEDSFGFILVNDNVQDIPPQTGNIFVRSNVRQIAGTFYADGGLMTNDAPTPTIENASNLESGNTVQLLLNGTLFTRNTLGGSLIQNDNNFFYPWGVTADQAVARKYDLHYVRRYINDLHADDGQPDDNKGNCAPEAGQCDQNENAFVIRIDRKAALLPPPGFEKKGQ